MKLPSKRQELEAARNMEPDCAYGAVGAGRYTRKVSERRECAIPAGTLPPCDLEWGHDGDMHANGGDGFYAEQHLEEHRRRQAERQMAEVRREP